MLSWKKVVKAARLQQSPEPSDAFVDVVLAATHNTPTSRSALPNPADRDSSSLPSAVAASTTSSSVATSTSQPPALPSTVAASTPTSKLSAVPPPIPAHLLSTPARSTPSPQPLTPPTSSTSSTSAVAAMTLGLQRRPSSEAGFVAGDDRRDSEKRDKEKQKRRWYQLLGKSAQAAAAEDNDDPSSQSSSSGLTITAPSPTPSPTSSSSNGSVAHSSPLALTHAVSIHSASSTTTSSSSSSATSASGWSFIRRSKAMLSSPDGQAPTRPVPPPINTSLLPSPTNGDKLHQPSPSPTAPAPSLHLPIADVVSRAAFASSFRSFLVSRYCQENIDFLLAVSRLAQSYQRQHPSWTMGEPSGGGCGGEEERCRVVYAASVKESGVDIAHDKSHYVSLLDATTDVGSTGAGPSSSTNLPKTALDIYHTYILQTGAQTVNIPAHTRLAIEHTVGSLQQFNNSGTERQPLNATLTPALFVDAVAEIERLLEREWLPKYYHTQQYAMLVQWMDRRERNSLMKEQATRQKKKLQEQLRRVAAAVRTPEPSSQASSQLADSPQASQHISIGLIGVELHLGSQSSPLSAPSSARVPLSPVSSTLRPSAVRAVGRLGRLPGKESEVRSGTFSASGSGNEAGWSLADPDTPTTPFTPSPASSAAPLSPITPLTPQSAATSPQFHPAPTPNMYLSPRRDAPRRAPPVPPRPHLSGASSDSHEAEGTPVSESSLSASFLLSSSSSPAQVDTTASMTSPSHLSFSQLSSPSPSTSKSPAGGYAQLYSPLADSAMSTPLSADTLDKRRRPHAIVTPLPFSLHDAEQADKEHKLRFHQPPETAANGEHNDFDRTLEVVLRFDEHSSDTPNQQSLDSNSQQHTANEHTKAHHSPEPSTASLSCSPSPHVAWPETSVSGKREAKGDSDGHGSGCSSEADDEDEEAQRELFEGSTDGTRFFSVQVVEDDSDDDAEGTGTEQGMGAAHMAEFMKNADGSSPITITAGQEQVKTWTERGIVLRSFCGTCGTHLMCEIPPLNVVTTGPGLWDGLDFKPSLHTHYQHCAVLHNDGLPKYKDMPQAFGGTGEMIAEAK